MDGNLLNAFQHPIDLTSNMQRKCKCECECDLSLFLCRFRFTVLYECLNTRTNVLVTTRIFGMEKFYDANFWTDKQTLNKLKWWPAPPAPLPSDHSHLFRLMLFLLWIEVIHIRNSRLIALWFMPWRGMVWFLCRYFRQEFSFFLSFLLPKMKEDEEKK